MKSNKKAFILLGCLSTFHLANARGFLKTSPRKRDESFEHVRARSTTSALMEKMSSIFSSCKDCETASPSPHLVTHDDTKPSNTTPESSGGNPSSSSSTPGSPPGQGSMSPTGGIGIKSGERIIETEKFLLGCYEKQTGNRLMNVSGNVIESCGDHCRASSYFSVNKENVCSCFSTPPKKQLSVNQCEYTPTPGDMETMEVYVFISVNDVCDQAETKSYRNKLVQESKSLGFDHVANVWKSSPFQHFNSGCGTNIYELSTARSGNSKTLTTTGSTMSNYASETSSKLTESISSRAELGYETPLWNLSAKMSAKADKTLNKFFVSTGAKSAESMYYYSYGVTRLAKVKQDFKNKKYFAMFTKSFINALEEYKNSNYDFNVAKDKIFKVYGTTVLESGYVGGYIKKSSTMTSSIAFDKFENEEERLGCYEMAASLEGGYGGFKGSGEGDTKKCNDDKLKIMQEAREAFKQQTKEESNVGGQLSGPKDEQIFEVTAETAELLTSTEMYPESDQVLKLRFLTDYLKEDKISPIEYSWWASQISISEFPLIQTNLEKHLEEYLKEMSLYLDKCKPCLGNLYFEQDTNKCGCYFYALDEKELDQGSSSESFGRSCGFSDGVAVVGEHNNGLGRSAFIYVNGKLEQEIKSGGGREYIGSYVAIDKYIAVASHNHIEIFQKSGEAGKYEYLRSIAEGGSYTIQTAGDLVAFYRYDTPIIIYSARSGKHLHTIDGKFYSYFKMTEDYIVTFEGEKTVKVHSVKQDYALVGSIELPGTWGGRLPHFNIFGEKVVVVSQGDGGNIYSVTGSLLKPLQLPDSEDVKKWLGWQLYGNIVSMTSQFVVVGCPRVDNGLGAAFVFDAETGEFLEKRTSLSPNPEDYYAMCIDTSGSYMISTCSLMNNYKGGGYFQTIVTPSSEPYNDNHDYTNTTSVIDGIMLTEY